MIVICHINNVKADTKQRGCLLIQIVTECEIKCHNHHDNVRSVYTITTSKLFKILLYFQ